jgi:hypothetical protein
MRVKGRMRFALKRLLLSCLLASLCLSSVAFGQESTPLPNGEVSARSFIDTAQVISKYTTEQYAHQSTLRLVKSMGYVVYQCNESTREENKAGQLVRMAVFHLLNPMGTVQWVDVCKPGESSNGITLANTFVGSPIIHALNDDTLRIFFSGRAPRDTEASYRVLYKDYTISTGKLSELQQVKCTVAKDANQAHDLAVPAVQAHLDHLFGGGFGAKFDSGINPACDMVPCHEALFSTIQIKATVDGKTRFMTNVLMRSKDGGATWELLGAPDPRHLPGEIQILAEPVLTFDDKNIYLHLRSNVQENGYVLSRVKKDDLFTFDKPVKKWTYGIGRPALADFGRPIGLVALFTAPSVTLSTQGVSRNRVDVVRIDRSYSRYKPVFSIVDYNAVNTPFMHLYNDEVYVSYSTGKRRLLPKYGTSEVMFSKLRREYFVGVPPAGMGGEVTREKGVE